ncbi:MAG: beta-glucanase precursor [Pseudomonadota bacterium]
MTRLLLITLAAVSLSGCVSATSPVEPPALDFGDFTSQTLTTQAWLALARGDYQQAISYAEKCAELYETEARKMQASMSEAAAPDKVHDYWALNDVGTSYFIRGEALTKLGRKTEAIASFKVVRDALRYAQAWDPKGWFWRPSTAAYPKIQMLEGDF